LLYSIHSSACELFYFDLLNLKVTVSECQGHLLLCYL